MAREGNLAAPSGGGIDWTRPSQGEPRRLKRATYDDVLSAPESQVAEILDGELFLSPRPEASDLCRGGRRAGMAREPRRAYAGGAPAAGRGVDHRRGVQRLRRGPRGTLRRNRARVGAPLGRFARLAGRLALGRMAFADALRALNTMKAERVVEEYAITGAMALVFWTEPVPTFDMDVLVLLPTPPGS